MVPPLVPNTGQHWPDLATQKPGRFVQSALQQHIIRWYFSPEYYDSNLTITMLRYDKKYSFFCKKVHLQT